MKFGGGRRRRVRGCGAVFFSRRKLTRLGPFSECRKGRREVRSTRTSTIWRLKKNIGVASNSYSIIALRGAINGGSLVRGVLPCRGRLRGFQGNPMTVLICLLLLASVFDLSLMERPDSS